MPRIPTYKAKLGLPTVAPAKRIDEAGAGIIGRALTQAGKEIAAFGEAQKRIEQDQAFAQASIAGYGALNQMKLDASQDSDFQGFNERYKERARTEGLKIQNTIKDSEARRQFQLDYEYKSMQALYNIGKESRGRFVTYDKALMIEELENTKTRLFSATTDTERELARTELASIIRRRKDNLVLTKPEAAATYRKTMANLALEQAEYDIYQVSPEIALEKLNAGEYGIKKTDPAKWGTLKKEAEGRIAQNTTRAKNALAEAQKANAIEMTKRLITEALQPGEIEEKLARGDITSSFATILKDAALSNKRFAPNPKAEIFVSTLDKFLAEDAEEKIASILETATKDFSNGDLTDEDYGYFIDLADKRFKERRTPRDNWFKNSIDTIKKWVSDYGRLGLPNTTIEITANMTKDLIQRTQGAEDPRDVVKDVIKDQVKEGKPEINSFDAKKGQLMIDANGNKAIVYPDGSYEEID